MENALILEMLSELCVRKCAPCEANSLGFFPPYHSAFVWVLYFKGGAQDHSG